MEISRGFVAVGPNWMLHFTFWWQKWRFQRTRASAQRILIQQFFEGNSRKLETSLVSWWWSSCRFLVAHHARDVATNKPQSYFLWQEWCLKRTWLLSFLGENWRWWRPLDSQSATRAVSSINNIASWPYQLFPSLTSTRPRDAIKYPIISSPAIEEIYSAKV